AGFGDVFAGAPTVTIDVILSIVFLGTPAFARSATDEYGLPAMIFFAVAGPTPGSASRSACDAVLRFTGVVGAFACALLAAAAWPANAGTASVRTQTSDQGISLRMTILSFSSRTSIPQLMNITTRGQRTARGELNGGENPGVELSADQRAGMFSR